MAALEPEATVVAEYPDLCRLLEAEGLEHERRGLRLPVRGLDWSLEGDLLAIGFELPRGAFATAVLHEIVSGAWDVAEGVSD
jgi:tRNA pseudouridine13 synthase